MSRLSVSANAAHTGSAISSNTEKLEHTPERPLEWARQAQIDYGERAGLTTNEREYRKKIERSTRDLREVNEILRKASAYFEEAKLGRYSDLCGFI